MYTWLKEIPHIWENIKTFLDKTHYLPKSKNFGQERIREEKRKNKKKERKTRRKEEKQEESKEGMKKKEGLSIEILGLNWKISFL